MSLYESCNALHAGLGARKSGAAQAVQTSTIDIGELEKFAAAVEAALPNATVNTAAIEKNGVSPLGDGGPMIPFAVKQRHPVKASVTCYYNGKIVWAGIEPCFPAQ